MNNRGLFAAGAVFFLVGLKALFLLDNTGLAISLLPLGVVFLGAGKTHPEEEEDEGPSDSNPPAE